MIPNAAPITHFLTNMVVPFAKALFAAFKLISAPTQTKKNPNNGTTPLTNKPSVKPPIRNELGAKNLTIPLKIVEQSPFPRNSIQPFFHWYHKISSFYNVLKILEIRVVPLKIQPISLISHIK